MKQTLLILVWAFLLSLPLSAREQRGLLFRSYDVIPTERTSLEIHRPGGGPLRFRDSVSIAFQLNIDRVREHFGYVCRFILDEDVNADLLLSTPNRGRPYLGFVSGPSGIERVELPAAFGQWVPMEFSLRADGDSVLVFINGKHFLAVCSPVRTHTLSCLFGANASARYATADVAPFSMRNLEWSVDGKPRLETSLGGPRDLVGPVRRRITISHPHWMAQDNRKWQHVKTFESFFHSFLVPDGSDGIYLVRPSEVVHYNFETGKVDTWPFEQDISHDQLAEDFIVLPDGTLTYVDFSGDEPVINRFSAASGWEKSLSRTKPAGYSHHNVFFNPLDSTLVQLFGYGYHRYKNETVIWSEKDARVRRLTLDKIPPRYLSAVGMSGTSLLIYGGKGNEQGAQEYGTRLFNDLYRLNLSDYSVQLLFRSVQGCEEIAAPELIPTEAGNAFYALTFNPDTYHTSLQLRSFDIHGGVAEAFADPLPFVFLDLDAEAHLVYHARTDALYAIVGNSKNGEGLYEVSLWRIDCPILPLEEVKGPRAGGWILAAAVLLALLAGAAAALRRKAVSGSVQEPEDPHLPVPEEEPLRPGICILGHFRVISSSGEDISATFSPLMKQLLALLILHSANGSEGISNAALKDILWFDKSDKSYHNNRNVNMRKLRICLDGLEGVSILAENGYWRLADTGDCVDYLRAISVLENPSSAIGDILEVVSHGMLLDDMRYEWTDAYKASYADKVIHRLTGLESRELEAETQICIADALLRFDSLDEEAARLKCRNLVRLGRVGTARRIWQGYCEQYRRMLGEEPLGSFNDFVR